MNGERVFLGLGTNLGDRRANLERAVAGITALAGTEVVRVSSYHETVPWGVTDQPAFLNAVAEIRTELEPEALLDAVKELERDLGREPSFRWGPRLIDIDLLIYGDRHLVTDRLVLPHPRMLGRPFVMEPLREIAPEMGVGSWGLGVGDLGGCRLD